MSVDGKYEAAVVFATVAFHMRHRQSRHGIRVSPSGRFLSVIMRLAGFLAAGMPACVRERCVISFRWFRRISRPDER